jgi:hypothetical protein
LAVDTGERKSERVRENPLLRQTPERDGPALMEVDNTTVRPKKLTFQEKQRRMKEGLCLYCGKVGHIAKVYPEKKVQFKINLSSYSPLFFLPFTLFTGTAYVKCVSIVRSGCTYNIISSSFAEKHFIATVLLQEPLSMTLADGNAQKDDVTYVCQPLDMSIGEHSEMIAPLVAIVKHDVILGLPWLRKHDQDIDWTNGELKWSVCIGKCLQQPATVKLVSQSKISLMNVIVTKEEGQRQRRRLEKRKCYLHLTYKREMSLLL